MNTLNVNTSLFGSKKKIKVLGGLKETNTLAPARVGYSSFRPSSATTAVKFSAVATFLDKALVEKSITVREVVDGIYCEFKSGGKTYVALCDGTSIMYEGAQANGSDALIPFILFHLGNDRRPEQEEFCDAFLKIVSEINVNGQASLDTVALACDSFYYGCSKLYPSELDVEENAVNREQLKVLNARGVIKPLASFVNVAQPPITAFDEHFEETDVEDDEDSLDSFWKSCLAGKYAIPHDWKEDARFIPGPDVVETFVPTEPFKAMVKKIHYRLTKKVIPRMDMGLSFQQAIAKDAINFMMVGEPGTGKTINAFALGHVLQIPVYSVPITKNTEEDTFQGVTKVIDGQLRFVETDFLHAAQNGGITIIEEGNLADAAVMMGSLGQFCEFPYILQKNGYETIQRHPLNVLIMTMNVGTYGSKGVNQALSSRFKQSYTLIAPSEQDFINILMKSGGASKQLAEWVYGAWDAIVSALKGREYNAEDICLNVTLRGCLGAIESIEEGAEPKDAIRDTLIGKIAEVDPAIATRIYDDVVVNLRDFKVRRSE